MRSIVVAATSRQSILTDIAKATGCGSLPIMFDSGTSQR